MAIDTKSYLSCAAHPFWSKRILNERQQRICIKMQIINSSQKDVEEFYVALVTYKLTKKSKKINDPSAKYVNLKEKF